MSKNILTFFQENGKPEKHNPIMEFRKTNDVVFDYGLDGKIVLENINKKEATLTERFGNLTFETTIDSNILFEYIMLKNERVRPLTKESNDIDSNLNHYKLTLEDIKQDIKCFFTSCEFSENNILVKLNNTVGKIVLNNSDIEFYDDSEDVLDLDGNINHINRSRYFDLGKISETIQTNLVLFYSYFNTCFTVKELYNSGEVALTYDFLDDYSEEFENYFDKKSETFEMYNLIGDCILTINSHSKTSESIKLIHTKTEMVLFDRIHKYKNRTKEELIELIKILTNII